MPTLLQAVAQCNSATTCAFLPRLWKTPLKQARNGQSQRFAPFGTQRAQRESYGGRRWPALVIVGHSVADDLSSATLFFARTTVPTTLFLFTFHYCCRRYVADGIQAASAGDCMASFKVLSSAGQTRSGVSSFMHLRCGHVRR